MTEEQILAMNEEQLNEYMANGNNRVMRDFAAAVWFAKYCPNRVLREKYSYVLDSKPRPPEW